MTQKFETELKKRNGWFDVNLQELFRYKDLIFLFVKRDFVAIYKQTLLGPAWAIIQPLLTTVVYTLLFGEIAQLGPAGIPAFIFYFSGTMLWTYFSGSLNTTANTFISNSSILSKVYFPRLVMPISSVISNLITLIIQFVFFIFFLVFYIEKGAIPLPNSFALLLPLLILQLMLLGLGCGIIVSALTTKYRDLKMLISFGLQLWMYAAPVAYDMFRFKTFAPEGKYHTLYMLNPLTPLLNVFRCGFLGIGEVEWGFYIGSWGITLLLLVIGIMLFSRVERTFMDTI